MVASQKLFLQLPYNIATNLDTQPFLGPMNFAWLTKDIAPDGVLGNAKTADAGRGALYLDQAAQETADLLNQILAFRFAEET